MAKNKLIALDEIAVSRHSMPSLVVLERLLWRWMDKTKGAANIARVLNMIHREVEWRAQDSDFRS
jgi:hypothetical protein